MVRFCRVLAALGVIALFSSHVAVAQSTAPNIVGVWVSVETSGAIYGGELWDGDTGDLEIEITEQMGHAFTGVLRWLFDHVDDQQPHDGSQHANQSSEDLLGVFTSDGASFVIAEHPDTGIMFGEVLDDDRLEIIYAESGEYAIVGRAVYQRRQ